jgi:radical SAM domain protein
MGCILNKEEIIFQYNFPKILFIELTKKCNLNCVHCFNDSGNTSYEIDFKNLVKIKKFFSKKNIEKIVLSGGEIFTLANSNKILTLFKNYKKIQVLTNGTLLSDKNIKTIIKNSINLQLTLNGHNCEIDSLLRDNKAFNLTVSNIKKLVKMGANSLLTVSYTIHKENANYIEDFIIYCEKYLKVNNIQFAFIGHVGRAINVWNSLGLSFSEKIVIMNTLLNFKEKYKNRIEITFSGVTQFINILENSKGNDIISCEAYNEELQIFPDLTVGICNKINKYLKCQNIKNIKWENMYSKKFYFKIKDKCITCPENKGCMIKCQKIKMI